MVNRSVTWADWDESMLALELFDLKGMDFDLELTGFDEDELEKFLASAGSDGLTDEDAAPEPPENPISKPGDPWLLGPHRVNCGDATIDADIRRLTNEHLVDMVFTDPPYNVDYEG